MGKMRWKQSIKLPVQALRRKLTCSNLLLDVLHQAVMFSAPLQLRTEMWEISNLQGIDIEEVAALNLDYELSGLACTTAAFPGPNGYRVLRALDWDIPASMCRTIRWEEIAPGVRIRQVEGYVGVVTGHNQAGHFFLSLNRAENCEWSLDGTPIAWLIREALLQPTAEAARAFLMHAKPLVGGYVTIIAPDHATWLEVQPGFTEVRKHVQYPRMLVVGNLDKGEPEKTQAVEAWVRRGARAARDPELFPAYSTATTDIVSAVV